ncbi:MAG: hypothetical protein JSW12_14280, partial [Deltaproteobacteria bacterium]
MLPRGGKFPEKVYSSCGDIVNQLLPGVGPALELSIFQMVMKGLCANIKTSCEERDFMKMMPAFCLLDMARVVSYLTPSQEALLRPPRLALER